MALQRCLQSHRTLLPSYEQCTVPRTHALNLNAVLVAGAFTLHSSALIATLNEPVDGVLLSALYVYLGFGTFPIYFSPSL
jgi:hypothetical protein